MRAASRGGGDARVLTTTGASLLVVTNRAPLTFSRDAQRLRFDRGAGGVVTALSHVSRLMPLTWVAATAGREDREVAAAQRERGGLVGSGRLTLRFIGLPDDLYADYYEGLSNRVLWFVQHGLWARRIDPEDAARVRMLADRYLAADRLFADAVSMEAHRPDRDVAVMSHDYQLFMLPALVREQLAGVPIVHFLHIPWPSLDTWLDALPEEIVARLIRGVLGADVIGFQDDVSRAHFAAATAALVPDAGVATDRISDAGRITLLRVRAASIDPGELAPDRQRMRALEQDPRRTVVRVDRVDPIKNIAAGFDAFGRVLARRPDLVGRVRFVARLIPSRMGLPEYRREWEDALTAIRTLNERFGPGTVELATRAERGRALAELAAADVVLVNSLADGMNLVAKEASVLNRRGALVLSRAAGAYAELKDAALGIDPRSIDETADAIEHGLAMSEAERVGRMDALRAAVLRWTARDWTRALMSDLEEVRGHRADASRRVGSANAT